MTGSEDDRVYLVTGAAGFTGSVLVRHLLNQNKRIRALIRKNHDDRELRRNGVDVVVGDLTDPSSLRAAVNGVYGIYHIAALFRRAGLPKEAFYAVNAEGTRHLIEAAEAAQVKRFIHCSTVGVLGHVANPPADEGTPYNPGDEYQDSKMLGEKLVLDHFSSGRMQGAVIRPAMIYGGTDRRMLKLFKMIGRGTFFYVGNGSGLVHFVEVNDLAKAFMKAMEHEEITNEVFIIAGEQSVPLSVLVTMIARELGVSSRFPHVPIPIMKGLGHLCVATCRPFGIEPPLFPRRVDFFTKDRSFDGSKAARMLGFTPEHTLEEELASIVSDYEKAGLLRRKRPGLYSTIVRSFSGKIERWDSGARNLYGWEDAEVIGKTSHDVLKTEFPRSLELINRELMTRGVWTGRLKHIKKDGHIIEVASTWRIAPFGRRSGNVIETNHVEPRRFGLFGLPPVGLEMAGGIATLAPL